MKLIILLTLWWFGGAGKATPPQELCKLKGSVYVTDRREEAHYVVYIEDYETSADLVVYAEENRLFADQPGVWHFTDKAAFADFRIYLADRRAFADFTIAYTEVASFAGCR